jgi:predicted ArsR family transcriptional regulator
MILRDRRRPLALPDVQRELLTGLFYYFDPADRTAAALTQRLGVTPAMLRLHLRALAAAGLPMRGSATDGYQSPLGSDHLWKHPPTGRRPIQVVKVRLTGAANRRHQTDRLYCRPEWYSEIARTDDESIVTFLARDLSFLLHWLRRAPAGVDVIGPPHIRQAVHRVRFC